jgi:hypothetical protein
LRHALYFNYNVLVVPSRSLNVSSALLLRPRAGGDPSASLLFFALDRKKE